MPTEVLRQHLSAAGFAYRADEGLLKISANGKESFFKAPEQLNDGSELVDFVPGKQTTVRLSVKGDGSEWAGKKCWVYGITPPEEGDWLQLYPDLYWTYYLPWKPEYGWYDCNKRNPTANPDGVPDGMVVLGCDGFEPHALVDRPEQGVYRSLRRSLYGARLCVSA